MDFTLKSLTQGRCWGLQELVGLSYCFFPSSPLVLFSFFFGSWWSFLLKVIVPLSLIPSCGPRPFTEKFTLSKQPLIFGYPSFSSMEKILPLKSVSLPLKVNCVSPLLQPVEIFFLWEVGIFYGILSHWIFCFFFERMWIWEVHICVAYLKISSRMQPMSWLVSDRILMQK